MLRLTEVALTARLALVVLMFLSGASTAAAQPYAWVPVAEFRDFVTPLRNILRVVNLGTTHVQSVELPSGIVLGQGAIDPTTGHYFLITNMGTGEFQASPPRLLPGVKPWAGSALFLSPDGFHAYVCQRPATTLTCALVRRRDDQILATRTGIIGVAFDQSGGHLIAADGPGADERTLQYFEAASPLMPVWSRSYRGLSWQLPLVAVSDGTVFTAQAIPGAPRLEALDSTTGATLRSAVIGEPVSMLVAGGGRVFGVSSSSSTSRITSFAATTLVELAHRDLGGPGFPFTIHGVNVTAEGEALIVRSRGRSTIYWAFGLMDAGTLADMPGGGFPGMGTQGDTRVHE